MINTRLLNTVPGSKNYIALNVFFQWIALAANITIMFCIACILSGLFIGDIALDLSLCMIIAAAALFIRFLCISGVSNMGYLSSKEVKKTLRKLIYSKLLKLGASYNQNIKTSEAVQIAVEGVDQLETYFGSYMPQLFYAIIAPVTLFAVLCSINLTVAIILIICVPLIPLSIAAVQTIAKKLLTSYWGQYACLGDTFLENLQGLTTLKIYRADEYKNKIMNDEAEKFRKITMKVLVMQLNSITVMDLIAYGGTALGIILSAILLADGKITLMGCLLTILLSAEFFLPMRQLGSFFHIAMNGMAASEKIFNLIDIEHEDEASLNVEDDKNIRIDNLSFCYDNDRKILKNISMEFPEHSFTAIIGASGSGKSTIASILSKRCKGYEGHITIGKLELKDISEHSVLNCITYVGQNSYLFKGSVKDNLFMADPKASDAQMWEALEKVNLADYMRTQNGLDTLLEEKASNLSGGQRQRLALARALLHDSPLYIFDEATSNIDMESENDIMEQIYSLAREKTVILISHRLANVVNSDKIYVINNGCIAESGTHDKLLADKGLYYKLWTAQQETERF